MISISVRTLFDYKKIERKFEYTYRL